MKILIIDKNKIEMKRIAKVIEQNIENVEMVGLVTNAKDAVGSVEAKSPDLIIVSNELENCSGYSVIEKIRKLKPNLFVIFYANQESIVDLKMALKLKIYHYIVNPVNKGNLIPVLAKINAEIDEEEKKFEMYNQSEIINKKCMPALEYSFIYSTLFNTDARNESNNFQKLFQVRNRGYVMLINFTPIERKNQVPYEEYSRAINTNLPYGYRCIIGPNMSNRIIIFVMEVKENSLDDKSRKMQQIKYAEGIRKFFLEELNTRVFIGIGSERSIDKLSISYEEALRSMRFEREKVVSHVYDIELEMRLQSQFYMELETKLLHSVRTGNADAFTSFTSMLSIMDGFKLEDKKNKVLELLILSAHEVRKNGPSTADYIDYIELVKEIEKLRSEEIDSFACRQLSYIIKSIREYQGEQSFGHIKNILKYIEDHFNEELSLQEMSKITNVSPQYFSRLFREKMDMTFVEYLTKVRINKAMEWLKHSDKNIQEICYDVGYKDPNYFSRVFKKNTGVSPKEYIEKRSINK